MLRALLEFIAGCAVRTFYRKVCIANRENIPNAAPVLFVANHWNSLIDPLVIQDTIPRPVTFCAAEFLFRGALGPVMRHMGFIPIFRASDSHDPQQNMRSFAKAFERLAEGGCVGIFPEGVSHSESHMQRIKSGAARIAFGAEEANNWSMDLQVVPLGLVWKNPQRFRGEVTVVVGEPIAMRDLRELAQEKPQRATRQLTNAIQEALERVTFSQETWGDHHFVERVTALTMPNLPEIEPDNDGAGTLDDEMRVRDKIRAGFMHLHNSDPESLGPLRREVGVYHRLLDQLGITDSNVREQYLPGKVARFFMRNVELAVIGWPLALWGLINNLIPHCVTVSVSRWVVRPREDRQSTYQIYPGIGFYLTCWIAQAGAVWMLTGSGLIAALYLTSLPLMGWYALSFFERRGEAGRSTRAVFLFLGRRGLRRHLRAKRERIIAMIREANERIKKESAAVAGG